MKSYSLSLYHAEVGCSSRDIEIKFSPYPNLTRNILTRDEDYGLIKQKYIPSLAIIAQFSSDKVTKPDFRKTFLFRPKVLW